MCPLLWTSMVSNLGYRPLISSIGVRGHSTSNVCKMWSSDLIVPHALSQCGRLQQFCWSNWFLQFCWSDSLIVYHVWSGVLSSKRCPICMWQEDYWCEMWCASSALYRGLWFRNFASKLMKCVSCVWVRIFFIPLIRGPWAASLRMSFTWHSNWLLTVCFH